MVPVRSPAQARASPQRMASGGQRGGKRSYLTVEACLVIKVLSGQDIIIMESKTGCSNFLLRPAMTGIVRAQP